MLYETYNTPQEPNSGCGQALLLMALLIIVVLFVAMCDKP